MNAKGLLFCFARLLEIAIRLDTVYRPTERMEETDPHGVDIEEGMERVKGGISLSTLVWMSELGQSCRISRVLWSLEKGGAPRIHGASTRPSNGESVGLSPPSARSSPTGQSNQSSACTSDRYCDCSSGVLNSSQHLNSAKLTMQHCERGRASTLTVPSTRITNLKIRSEPPFP